MSRNQYISKLNKIKEDVLKMSGIVERIFSEALNAIEKRDVQLAQRIVADDKEVNQLETQIVNESIHLFATQQPVAKDLRKLISAIKIAGELERIADLSVDIAKVAIRLEGQEFIKPLNDIPKMAEKALRMLEESMGAYLIEDVEVAQSMANLDHQVDALFAKVVRDLHILAAEDKNNVELMMHLAFIARYIERIGDHATNIGENVIYLVTAEKPDLN